MKKQIEYTLNQDWRLFDGNIRDEPGFHTHGIPQERAVTAQLPCFTHMYVENHVGVSWYEKTFDLPCMPQEGEVALLCFEQAVFRTEVSVNGQMAGEHVGGEDPFAFDVTRLLREGSNRITVRTSKPHDEDVDGYTFQEIPHRNQTPRGLKPGWCYNVSGLCGEVRLRILPAVYIDDLYLIPDADTGSIRVRASLCNALGRKDAASVALEVRRAPDGDAEDRVMLQAALLPGDNTVEAALHIPQPRLWDVDEPNLYEVRICAVSGAGEHSAVKKTGFRTFRVREDGYFELNGRRVLVRCSHTGNCMPESTQHISRDVSLLRRDFLMAKAAGFNMIRFISGAALPLQLDLCDEIGLMIYEEPVSSWQEKNGPHAAECYRHDLLSMVRRDRSHPCITVWGLLNETRATPPFDEVCRAAAAVLPDLRDLDETRLVLFSSGRWDRDASIGSVANPGMREWQNLWGRDGDASYDGGDLGDIHYYPDSVPLRPAACRRMRTFGADGERPVFVSESGVGSALDTVSAVRYYDRPDAIAFAPDLQMYRQMNTLLLNDLDKYGFRMVFPSELMQGSMRNHVYYREQAFDQLRANPKVCGISLTGLLDHSICGEGLWTIWRAFKPGIADVLQDGFAPLRWCVFPSAPAVFEGDDIGMEVLLASEDKLEAGQEYVARAGVVRPDGSVLDLRVYRFIPTEEQVRTMVIPVFHESWSTAGQSCGLYRFRVELMGGGYAACGVKEFHVLPRTRSLVQRSVCAVGLSDQQQKTLCSLGYTVLPPEQRKTDNVIVTGVLSSEQAAALAPLLENGARILAACGAFPEDHSEEILPPARRPAVNRNGDSLYHRETVLRPGARFLKSMQTGLADALLYTHVIVEPHYEADGLQLPDETDAFAFETGEPTERGYMGGFKLGLYRVGQGQLALNTFDLLDQAEHVPYAAQLLVNILDQL